MQDGMVRVGTVAQAGDSGKQAVVSHQLWTGDGWHWHNWRAGLGLGATALVLIKLCSNRV